MGGGFGMGGGGGGGGGGMSLRMAVAALGGSSGGGISGAVREVASNPTAVIAQREREKRDLQDLNDRFASYIERVRFLEADNKRLQSIIDAEGEIRTARSHPQGDVRSRTHRRQEDHRRDHQSQGRGRTQMRQARTGARRFPHEVGERSEGTLDH